jgi:hypothetical protein
MICEKCKKPVSTPSLPFVPILVLPPEYITYSGKYYHKECFARALQSVQIKDDKLEIHLDIKISDTVKMIDSLWLQDGLRKIAIKLATIVAEHSHDYVQCKNENCQRLLSRHNAIVGEKTRVYQDILLVGRKVKDNAAKDIIPPHRVMFFCSKQCDMYYASHLHLSIGNRLKEVHTKYEELEKTAVQLCSVYSENKTEEEKVKLKIAFDLQLKTKKKIEQEKCMKDVEDMIKKVLG